MTRNHVPLVIAAGAGVVAGTLLTGSASSVLPLVIVLACPLLMLLMMAGMHAGKPSPGDQDERRGQPAGGYDPERDRRR